MKNTVKAALVLLIVLIAGLSIFSKLMYEKEIDRSIPVTIYRDGEAEGKSVVHFFGKLMTDRLSKERQVFEGDIVMNGYKIEGEGVSVRWSQEEKQRADRAVFVQQGRTQKGFNAIIDKDMTSFAMRISPGRYAATSEELYEAMAKLNWEGN
ncbi:MAG TPA: hypothetical protein DHM90_03205 [Clostridiaceae bacterium]|nr:hypothetical protein [Clostridiaceae bacterium]